MFVAMNRFTIVPGREAEFEEIWRTRDSHLSGVAGILRFALLKGDADGEYISHSTWESRGAFMAWMQSPAFAAGHRGASMAGIVAAPPQVKLYDSVIAQEFAATTA
jgi:heme-degrading monooxygenase HmoA